jgi:hypothetical protein
MREINESGSDSEERDENPFAQRPEKTGENGDVSLRVIRFLGEQDVAGLPKDVWINKIMGYLSLRDLNNSVQASRRFRFYAREAIRCRARMFKIPGGDFFSMREASYRILLSNFWVNNKALAVVINRAWNDPLLQKHLFNKMPTPLFAKCLSVEPEKLGMFMQYLLDNAKFKKVDRLNYIFKHFESLLERLDKKGVDAVMQKISQACDPRVVDRNVVEAMALSL